MRRLSYVVAVALTAVGLAATPNRADSSQDGRPEPIAQGRPQIVGPCIDNHGLAACKVEGSDSTSYGCLSDGQVRLFAPGHIQTSFCAPPEPGGPEECCRTEQVDCAIAVTCGPGIIREPCDPDDVDQPGASQCVRCARGPVPDGYTGIMSTTTPQAEAVPCDGGGGPAGPSV